MNILIRVDASYQIGTGHVMRCLTLADVLSQRGANVQFICREHLGNSINKIKQRGYPVVQLVNNTNLNNDSLELGKKLFHADWLGCSQKEDVKACQEQLGDVQFDWLVVDHYSLDYEWEMGLKNYYRKLMVIDDLADRKHICDVLLDQNYGSDSQKYHALVPPYCSVLAGTNYTLLRPEFAQWRQQSFQNRINPIVKNVIINMGGLDSENMTEQVLIQLNKARLLDKLNIIVVMGESSPHLEEVNKTVQAFEKSIDVLVNVDNMAELMANADLAIGASGSTTWERCCLGLPSIQLVVADNQRKIAQELSDNGIVILAEKIEELPGLVSFAECHLEALSSASMSVCDGLGADRVADVLMEKCCNEN